MLFALDICANKASPTRSVHWGLNPSPTLKTIKHSKFEFIFHVKTATP